MNGHLLAVVLTCCTLIALPHRILFAEGTNPLSPTSTDEVLLHTNASGFANFASYNGPAVSRLYVRIDDFSTETLYIGLSAEADDDGVINSTYEFRIKDPDGIVVHGPFLVTTMTQNTPTWALANAGPDVLDPINGYNTAPAYAEFDPSAVGKNGDYYIEFTDIPVASIVNVKWYDFTVVNGAGAEELGRLWSNTWALRTPPLNGNPPECDWDRPFNGVFYSYTEDGFVSRIDFNNSGFQGLSFTVAFGDNGPGNTGDVIEDRKSVNAGDSTANAADHMVFVNEPDEDIFMSPLSICGDVEFFGESCVNDSLCVEVGVTRMGQVEILLDFFGNNGVYDPNTTDVILAKLFETPDTACILWDKLRGDGSPPDFNEPIMAYIQYSQGVQHYAAFDLEFLQNGFCIQTIRPICSPQSNLLYWDDSEITDNISTPFIDESDPGTGQPLVQLSGCVCQVNNCRTWDNFQLGSNPATCDGAPAGYGDFRTLNTWWFAASEEIGPFDLILVRAQIVGDTVLCEGDSTTLTVETNPDTIMYDITWTGPNGFMASTANTGFISEPGTYVVTIFDPVTNCSATDSVELVVAESIMTTIDFMCIGNNSPNADVDLTVSGGAPPYMYLWNTGAMTEDLMDVPPGLYTVTVTDTLGCTVIDSVTVDECCTLDISCPPTDGGQFDCDIPPPDTTLIMVNDFCVSVMISSSETDNGGSGCAGDTLFITRTYLVTDGLGNTASCVQVFTVVDDVAPTVEPGTCPAAVSVSCNDDSSPGALGTPSYMDNCSAPGDITVTFSDDSTGFDGNCTNFVIGEIERTFYGEDLCGNVDSSCVQVIMVTDTEAPTFTTPADLTILCTSDSLPATTGMVNDAEDNCTNVTISFSDMLVPGECPAVDTIIRTWTVEDACGNASTGIQRIARIDNDPPTFTVPSDVTIECTEDTSPANTGDVTDADDDCSTPMVNFTDMTMPGDCPASDTIFRTWVVTDACGNSASGVQSIILIDNTPPVFTLPSDTTIECDDDSSPSNTGELTNLMDGCTGVDSSFSDMIVPGECPVVDTIFRTWIATDDCGNSASGIQVIVRVDTEPPMLVPGTCPSDTIIACGTPIGNFGNPSYTDNCTGVTVTSQDEIVGFMPPSSEGMVIRTFYAEDGCGNIDSSCVQTITVVDTMPPSLECPADVSVVCGMPTDTSVTGVPVFTDNCGMPADITLSFDDDSVGFTTDCIDGTIVRTFTVEDPDGNISTCAQNITIFDTIPPVFTVPVDITVDCDIDLDDLSITGNVSGVSDCSTVADTNYTDMFGMIGCNGTGEIFRTWSVSDACGNVATQVQMIMVQDTIPPNLVPPPDVTISCTQDPTDTTVTGSVVVITDMCSMMFMLEYEDDTTGLTGCSNTGVIIRRWFTQDDCDNFAEMTQLITVIDITPPIAMCQDITLNFDDDSIMSITPEMVDGGSFDECGNISLFLSRTTFDCIEFRDDPTLTVQLTASDECGNSSTCDVNITGEGGGGIIMECPDDIFKHLKSGECGAYINFTVNAERRCGTEDPVLIRTDTTSLDTGDFFPIGVYQFSYVAFNDLGDTAFCDFVIHVIENVQTTNVLVCNEFINISLDENCESFINPDMILEGGDFGCFDDFLVEIEGVGGGFGGILINNQNIIIGNMYTVTITDTKTGNNCWSTILVEDKLPPVVECFDEEILCTVPIQPVFAMPDSQPLPYAPPAFDNCGEVIFNYEDVLFESACSLDSIHRTWYISDEAGNVTICFQRIIVLATSLDQVVFPPPYEGECNGSSSPSVTGWPTINGVPITQNQLCNIWSYYEDQNLVDCGNGTKILRRWTVFDACTGELERGAQVIKLSDNQPPELTCPEDQTYSTDAWFCFTDIDLITPIVFDACGSDYTLQPSVPAGTGNLVAIGGGNYRWEDVPEGTWVVQWHVTDACGNASVCTYNVTIEDDIPPVAICDAHTIISLTEDYAIDHGLTKIPASVFDNGSYDNCSDVTLTVRRMDSCIDFDWTTLGAGIDEEPNGIVNSRDRGTAHGPKVPFVCCDAGQGPILVELKVTDANGNFSLCMVEVEVQDKLAPYIECPPNILVSCDFWFNAEETAGFVPQEDDPLTPVFGRVLDAYEYDQEDRQEVVIDDPGNDELVQPHSWGLEGWADDNCNVDLDVRVRIFDDCSGEDLPNNAEFPKPDNAVRMIERTFRAVDPQGNNTTCRQIIWVVDFDPFFITDITCNNPNPNDDVIWPCDIELNDCPAGDLTPEELNSEPTVFDDVCSIIGVIYKDKRFEFVEDACFKIIRTWTIIDWCQFDELTGEGLWEYDQIIKVLDTAPPDFEDCPQEPVELCVADPNVKLPLNNQVYLGQNDPEATSCSAHVRMERVIEEMCTHEVEYDVKLYLFDTEAFMQVVNKTTVDVVNDSAVLVFNTETSAIQSLREDGIPYNSPYCDENYYHRILWTVEDGCGNVSTCEYLFRLEDCKEPSPVCINGLSTVVMPSNGEVTLWAVDFNASSFDDCTPVDELLYSFSGEEYLPSRVFTCEDIVENGGSPSFLLDIWVADNGNDDNCNEIISWDERNKDFCTTFVIVEDNENVCEGDSAGIAGTIITAGQETIELVNVHLTGSNGTDKEFVTGDDGYYYFFELTSNVDYTVVPARNDNHKNGVSTLDLVRIQKHLLGMEPFTDPYLLIAADANNSESVTTVDLIEIRRLVLGINEEFTNNSSWRFVRAGFEFIDPFQPWPFAESSHFDQLDGVQMHTDFIGVKIGDVNQSAVANAQQVEVRSGEKGITFSVPDAEFKPGEIVQIDITAEQMTTHGFQFTLRHEGLEYLDFKPGIIPVDEQNLGSFGKLITMSVAQPEALTVNEYDVLFTLLFRAERTGKLSEIVTINSDITNSEIYVVGMNDHISVRDIELEFRESIGTAEIPAEGFALYQNQPNPWSESTNIGFALPKAMHVTLTFFDLSGKVLYVKEVNAQEGYSQFVITNKDLPAKAVMYYRLDAIPAGEKGLHSREQYSASKKMLMLE